MIPLQICSNKHRLGISRKPTATLQLMREDYTNIHHFVSGNSYRLQWYRLQKYCYRGFEQSCRLDIDV